MNQNQSKSEIKLNAKKSNANQSEKKELKSINLDSFAKELESKGIRESKGMKESQYIYPEGFSKSDINGEKGKNFRGKLRRNLFSHANNIFFYAKGKNIESLKEEIKKFESFYKSNYCKNDLSIDSLFSGNDESKRKDIKLMIDIIKSCK